MEFKRVGTHHGRFHADEVMATAILKEIFELELTRTRDMEVLGKLDIVYDVGGGEFDHHGIEKVYRDNDIPYAACGLIWRKFGGDVIRFRYAELKENEVKVFSAYIDRVLMQGIDALDNGLDIVEEDVPLMNISRIIAGFNPPWHSEKSEDKAFEEAVGLASKVLVNTTDNRYAVLKSRDKVQKAYEGRILPEVIVLDSYCPWGENLRDIDGKEEVFYVIYPSKENYAIQTVRGRNREDRKPFPKSWAGKRDEELAAVTGVKGSVFCHTGRFITVADSLDGALELAHLAINEPEEKHRVTLFEFIRRMLTRR